MKLKEMFSSMKCKTVAIAAASIPMLYSASAFATGTLSTEEQGMVTTIQDKIDGLSGAVRTLIAANLGLVGTIIVGGFIVAYFWKAGR